MPDAMNATFQAKALAGATLRVARFSGREELSRLFRFEVELVSPSADLDLDALVGSAASLGVEVAGERRNLHGLIAEAEQLGTTSMGDWVYRVAVVPRLWLMGLSEQNQIFGAEEPVPVDEILRRELKGDRLKGPAQLASPGLLDDDFTLRLSESYPERDYVVQYQESDLAFVSRLMEHWGIYYFFDHGDGRDLLVVCDSRVHHPDLAGGPLLYREASSLVPEHARFVSRFRAVRRQVAHKVILKDYNYRTPKVSLSVEAPVTDEGHGVLVRYGEHFKTPEEGNRLARIRAEAELCRRMVFNGASGLPLLQPGYRFRLDEHERSGFNARYLVTEVRHEARLGVPGLDRSDSPASRTVGYWNEFVCIPADVQFRAPQTTPKPRLAGIMHGFIDSESLTDRAEIDDQGRYKVVIPFDLSGAGQGKASRFIRMAQPYGGSSNGMHFPLTKGTEVVWSCIGGDPDRPIILGAVPSPSNPSVVNQQNATSNMIRTTSGIVMEFQDGQGG